LQYRQQSRLLVELREKERTLALTKRFVDAQKVKNVADQIQVEETEHQIQNMETDIERRRQKLMARHKQEMTVFFTHVEDTRVRMVQQRDQLIGGYLARLGKLTRQLARLGPQEPESCLSAERTAAVTDSEYSYPIPRIRPGSTFTHARKERMDR
jgi:TolA-binding protein